MTTVLAVEPDEMFLFALDCEDIAKTFPLAFGAGGVIKSVFVIAGFVDLLD